MPIFCGGSVKGVNLSVPLLQVNELQLHGTTKHRVAALHMDSTSHSGLDWESRGALRCAHMRTAICT